MDTGLQCGVNRAHPKLIHDVKISLRAQSECEAIATFIDKETRGGGLSSYTTLNNSSLA